MSKYNPSWSFRASSSYTPFSILITVNCSTVGHPSSTYSKYIYTCSRGECEVFQLERPAASPGVKNTKNFIDIPLLQVSLLPLSLTGVSLDQGTRLIEYRPPIGCYNLMTHILNRSCESACPTSTCLFNIILHGVQFCRCMVPPLVTLVNGLLVHRH